MALPVSRSHTGEPDLWLDELRWLRSLALRLVGDPNVAEDLVQETALLALSRRRDSRADRPWRAGVLRRLLSNGRRSRARRAGRERTVARPDGVPPYEDLAIEIESQRRIVDALLALDEVHGRVLILRYFHDLPVADIARRLEVPEPTIRSRISRALAKLRDELDRRTSGDRSVWMLPLIAWLTATAHAETAAASTWSARVTSAAAALPGRAATGARQPIAALLLVASIVGVLLLASGDAPFDASTAPPQSEGRVGARMAGAARGGGAAEVAEVASSNVASPSTGDASASAAASEATVPFIVVTDAFGVPVESAVVTWAQLEEIAPGSAGKIDDAPRPGRPTARRELPLAPLGEGMFGLTEDESSALHADRERVHPHPDPLPTTLVTHFLPGDDGSGPIGSISVRAPGFGTRHLEVASVDALPIEVALEPAARLVVRAVDFEGSPVEGVHIIVHAIALEDRGSLGIVGGAARAPVATDAEGFARFTDLPAGLANAFPQLDANVRARFRTGDGPGGRVWFQQQKVELVAGEERTIDLVLQQPVEVFGTVRRDGRAIGGGALLVHAGGVSERTAIAPDGTFRLEGNRSNGARLLVIDDGTRLVFPEVPLVPGEPTDLAYTTVRATIEVRGFVGERTELTSIELCGLDGLRAQRTIALDRTGRGLIERVPAGLYRVQAALPEGLSWDGDTVEVVAGGRVEVALVESSLVRVHNPEGRPLTIDQVLPDGRWRRLVRESLVGGIETFRAPHTDGPSTFVLSTSTAAPLCLARGSGVPVTLLESPRAAGGSVWIPRIASVNTAPGSTSSAGACVLRIEPLDGDLPLVLRERPFGGGGMAISLPVGRALLSVVSVEEGRTLARGEVAVRDGVIQHFRWDE